MPPVKVDPDVEGENDELEKYRLWPVTLADKE